MSQPPDPEVLAAGVTWWHGWKWTGNFTTLDLIAAGTNALNGALLARRPDHYKNFTVVGILLMAFLMGRPMLGRKLKGKSKREMAYLGLSVNSPGGEDRP